ncbi:MAG: response regulator [Polyangiaceae bacterium]
MGTYEMELLSASGEVVPVAVVSVMSTLHGEPVRIAGLRDLRAERQREAERRRLEQQVESSQRLESLGVLAGGIAHDFNNLLVGVLGNADFLLEQEHAPDEKRALQAIHAAAERAAALTAQMLAYAGQRGLGRREPIDLGLLSRELGSLLEAVLSKKATLKFSIAPNSVVCGDRATLTQVLMNLLTNASDALAEREGEIMVRSELVALPDSRWGRALGAKVGPGDWVAIEVRDSGMGMAESTRQRIFEPFFSTKEKGHGLGLAACLGIVEAHGGAILVESQLGFGSSFCVLLPASRERVSRTAAAGFAPRTAPCTVLVADDETVVRGFLRRSLERRGYLVLEAGDGLEALAQMQGNAVDVVVLDMTMPKLDGAEVVRKLRAGGSKVPVLLSSGYTDVDLERALSASDFQGFLPKPYGIGQLVDAIERALRADH